MSTRAAEFVHNNATIGGVAAHDGGEPYMQLFNLGHITATPGAFAALAACSRIPITYLARHAAGDFGALSEEDRNYNLQAIQDNSGRILSAYVLPDGERIWIITNLVEAGQNDTCLLLPDEY